MDQTNKLNYIPLLTIGIIHCLFLWLIIFPAIGWFTVLGIIPIFGYKLIPVKYTNFNFIELFTDIISFGLGMFLTIWVIIKFSTSSVFSAALIGTFAAFIPNTVLGLKPKTIKKISHGKLAIYAGAFAGMTSFEYFTSVSSIIYITITGGILYHLLQNSVTGIGGKLGSIGFGATIIYISIQQFIS